MRMLAERGHRVFLGLDNALYVYPVINSEIDQELCSDILEAKGDIVALLREHGDSPPRAVVEELVNPGVLESREIARINGERLKMIELFQRHGVELKFYHDRALLIGPANARRRLRPALAALIDLEKSADA